MYLLHSDDELVDMWVALPQSVESQDDLYSRCAVEASCMVGEMVKELAGRDASEEGEGVAQLLDPG